MELAFQQLFRLIFALVLLFAPDAVLGVPKQDTRLGRTDVSQYVKDHPEDANARGTNIMCAPVEYQTFDIFHYGRNHTEYELGAVLYTTVNFRFNQIATVNHHGRGDHLALSGANNPYFTFYTLQHREFSICVHHEPCYGGSDLGPSSDPIEGVSVDWFLWESAPSYARNPYGFYFEDITPKYNDSVCVSRKFNTALSAVLVTASQYYTANGPREVAAWVDAVVKIRPDSDSSDYNIWVCISGGIEADVFTEGQVNISGMVMMENKTASDGIPPDGTYQYESGNALLPLHDGEGEGWRLACIDKPFVERYFYPPLIFVSPSYRENTEGGQSKNPPITAWVEFTNELGFRACVARTRFAGHHYNEGLKPSLEYMVVTYDGFYSEQFYAEQMFAGLSIRFENIREFASVIQNVMDFDGPRNFARLLIELNEDRYKLTEFYVRGHEYYEPSASVTLHCEIDNVNEAPENYVAIDTEAVLEAYFAHGVPYFDPAEDYPEEEEYRRRLSNWLYPAGAPTQEEIVQVVLTLEKGCSTTGFLESESTECSVSECKTDSYSGEKTITRQKMYPETSGEARCPPLSITVPCNRPPCTVEEALSIRNWEECVAGAGGMPGWAIAIIVIAVVAVVGGVGFWYYRRASSGVALISDKA